MIIEIERHTQINDVLCKIDAQATARINAGSKLTIEIHDNKYTKKQRGSLHVWCDMCAQVLRDHGMTCEVKHPFNNTTYELPWTGSLFKENVYKFVLNAMTGKTSTEDQSTINPSDVAMVINKRYADNGLVCPPWPSKR